MYERQESNANGMDFFFLQIIRIYYVLCFVHVMSNASEIISNIFMFLMYSPLLLLFLLCNYLHNFRNLKIENEHVHIFWYLMFVCVISISMHVYIYISTCYISCSRKCLYTVLMQLHNVLLQSFLLFFHFLFLFVCGFCFFFC